MKRWRAPRTIEPLLEMLIALGVLALAGMSAVQLMSNMRGPIETWLISLRWFGFLIGAIAGFVLAAALLWRAMDVWSLGYLLDRNAITVVRRTQRYLIPLGHILDVAPAELIADNVRATRFGRGGPAQTLMIATDRYIYALALAQRDQFLRELQERQRLGTSQVLSEGLVRRYAPLVQFGASSPVRWLVMLGLLLNLVLWALLTWQFPVLPETVPIRFDPLGGTAGTRARSYTLLLPSVASAVWIGNLLLAVLVNVRSRLASELLLLGAVVVQIVALVAVWSLVGSV